MRGEFGVFVPLNRDYKQRLELLRREMEVNLGSKVVMKDLIGSIISEFLDKINLIESQKEDCNSRKKE